MNKIFAALAVSSLAGLPAVGSAQDHAISMQPVTSVVTSAPDFGTSAGTSAVRSGTTTETSVAHSGMTTETSAIFKSATKLRPATSASVVVPAYLTIQQNALAAQREIEATYHIEHSN